MAKAKDILKHFGVVGSLLAGKPGHAVGGVLGAALKKKNKPKDIDAFHDGHMEGVNDNNYWQ